MEKMKKVVVIGGIRYESSELKPHDLLIDEADGEGKYIKASATVWFDRDGEPVIAEPYRESSDGSRWYYSRELDFGI